MAISRRNFIAGTPLSAATALALPSEPSRGRDNSDWPGRLRQDHDLNLPVWGPYTKKYFGISHIPNGGKGLRFDLGFFPGFFRRTPLVPNIRWESGYYPWEAASDLSYYRARFELEWKDQVYVDLSFVRLSEDARLICCEAVNRTNVKQGLSLHFMASMQFPPSGYEVDLPAGAVWIDALEYQDLKFARPRPTDTLVPDGLKRAEIRETEFVSGRGVGKRFGADAGDSVDYLIEIKQAIPNATLVVRYRNSGTEPAEFVASGIVNGVQSFPSATAVTTTTIPVGDLPIGKHALKLTSSSNVPIDLDGFVITGTDAAKQVRFLPVRYTYQPEISQAPNNQSLILKYTDVDCYYGLAWDFDQFQVREFRCGDLDNVFRYFTHDHVDRVMTGPGEGHYTDAFLRPVTVAPHSSRTIWALVCSGTREEVTQCVRHFTAQRQRDTLLLAARKKRAAPEVAAAGSTYSFSQERMAATALTNVVYPLYIRGRYIKHNTPGRWWDSFYTWDSGFCGLGLLEHDLRRAVDCLNTYTFAPGDPFAAFLHHGSPVPVQIYLLQEIWNRTQSRPLLEYFYPRLRSMYLFLAGRLGSSTTRRFKSQILNTWDYFYNSGGWDDYPPQVYVHSKKLTNRIAPVVNTSHAIRTAKILKMAAETLGKVEDAAVYDADVEIFSQALQQYSWDEDSGYFGYVLHDANGRPEGILRHEGGQNFNMGLDGITPMIAGICTASQVNRICERLMSTSHLWTAIGISTVDQSAKYFRRDGYWNGAVWMPHQWFVWKALLDIGRAREANKVAHTALDVWKTEVEESYNCFEHFLVESGRGAGWHQFGGLSSPVMSWFGAYYRPGRLTTGFDSWVSSCSFSPDYRSLRASLNMQASQSTNPTVLVTMEPAKGYRVTWAGRQVSFSQPSPGLLEIGLPTATSGPHELTITSKS